MISLITVHLDSLDYCLPVMLESVLNQTKFISEVIIAHVDVKNAYEENWEERGIKFKKFGYPISSNLSNQGYQHAYGLHACIEKVSKDYVLFTDPDTFFYPAVDEIYLNLIEKYNLNIIGCSHHTAIRLAQKYFPYLVGTLVKKSELPDESFLKGKLIENLGIEIAKRDGKYLIPGQIMEHYQEFPNRDYDNCTYDTGCNLYLWAKQQNWRWMSFQTVDCNTYTTKYYRTNFKIKDKLPIANLIYHIIGGTRPHIKKEKDNFIKNYEQLKNDYHMHCTC